MEIHQNAAIGARPVVARSAPQTSRRRTEASENLSIRRPGRQFRSQRLAGVRKPNCPPPRTSPIGSLRAPRLLAGNQMGESVYRKPSAASNRRIRNVFLIRQQRVGARRNGGRYFPTYHFWVKFILSYPRNDFYFGHPQTSAAFSAGLRMLRFGSENMRMVSKSGRSVPGPSPHWVLSIATCRSFRDTDGIRTPPHRGATPDDMLHLFPRRNVQTHPRGGSGRTTR